VKRLAALCLIFIFFLNGKAQCLQIESILVDACATSSNEPLSEMVRFKNGNLSLNISQISIAGAGGNGIFLANKWPNTTLSWFGLVQNAHTAYVTSQFDSTINPSACGVLLEPPSGIIPANATVILICSEYPAVALNNFTGLNDTIYLVYQDTVSSVTSGHFANYSTPSGNRSLAIFDNQHGCSDTVTYDKVLLVNQLGLPGAQDGATVIFNTSGSATYINNGCSAPYSALSVDAGNVQSGCNNATYNLTATASGQYTSVSWSGGSGSFSSSSSLSTVYTPGPGENGSIYIYVTINSACGGFSMDSVELSLTPGAIASVSSSSGNSICQGQNTTLTASGGTSYSWQPGGNTSASVTVSSTGIYTVTATTACGSDTETFFLNVTPLPLASLSASGPLSFCQGDSVTLYASGGLSYLWSDASGSDSLTVNSSGFYWVTASNSCGSDSSGVYVDVFLAPTLSVSASSTVFCSGDSVQLTGVTQQGNPVIWQPNNIIAGSIYVSSGGTYSATVQSSCGNVTDSISIQSVNPLVISLSSSAGDSICSGSSTALTASGAGAYTWSTGATTSSITVNASGNYFVYSANTCGPDTAFYDITVVSSPTLAVSASSVTVCSGDSVLLVASTQAGNTLNWQPGNSSTSSIYVSTGGTYTATSQNMCGSTIDSVSLQVISAVNISLSSSPGDTICAGDSLTLTASGGNSYTWSTGAVSSSLNISTQGNYFVYSSNACGADTAFFALSVINIPFVSIAAGPLMFCTGDSVLLTAGTQFGNTINWQPSGSSSDSIYVTVQGTYSVTVQNMCGSDSDSITVQTEAPLNISVSASEDTVCQGALSLLTASGNNAFNWSTGAVASSISVSSPGNYFVYASNSCGADTAFFQLSVISFPVVSVSASALNLCAGQTSTLSATTNTSGNLLWSTGSGSSSITVSTAGTYSAVFSNQCGTDTSNSIQVSLQSLPIATATASSFTICPGDSVFISGSGTGTFLWSNGSTASSFYTSQPGTYSLVVSNSCGSDTANVTITQSTVNAQFTASPAVGVYPLNVSFSNSSTNALSYQWSFGDSSTSQLQSPSYLYQAPGSYSAMLTVTNADGCSDSAVQTILVLASESFVVIPNIFSPNSDGLNELLSVSAYAISGFEIVIYDRWGLKIFESTDLSKSWDGSNAKGEKCTEGTYYYLVKAEGIDGKQHAARGFVLLVK
jgi:gliding motility-associated-like protein